MTMKKKTNPCVGPNEITMNKTKRYRLARTSTQIARETLFKAIIILVVLLVMQLKACEAKAGTDTNVSGAFFSSYFVLRRPWLKKHKNKRRASCSCKELEEIRRRQTAKRNDLPNIEDTKAAG
jgi:hypothetical protein